jgi:hypothetical protein
MPSLNIHPVKVKRDSAIKFRLQAKTLNISQIELFDMVISLIDSHMIPVSEDELNPTEFVKSHFNNAIWETYFKTEPDALTDYIVSYDNKPPKTANYRSEQYTIACERLIEYFTSRNKIVNSELLLPR